jgi:hypothetical protein
MKVYPLEIVSDAKGSVLRVLLNNGETWAVKGECLRCGKCCERGTCLSYKHEILNEKYVAKCEAQWSKPWQCKMFPTNPYDKRELIEGCGYSWEKIN